MIDLISPFTVKIGEKKLKITLRKAGGSTVFVAEFPDGNQPLVVTRANGEKNPVFWTSIPEGRQKEAEGVGPLITAHYKEAATKTASV